MSQVLLQSTTYEAHTSLLKPFFLCISKRNRRQLFSIQFLPSRNLFMAIHWLPLPSALALWPPFPLAKYSVHSTQSSTLCPPMHGMKNSFLVIEYPKIETYSNVLHINGVVQRKINEILPRFLPLYAVGLVPY